MGILSRVVRMCKADMHGVMDQMEDQDLLLKQHIREMASALGEKRAQSRALLETLSSCEKDIDETTEKLDRINADIDLALGNQRDDIARTLIRKLKSLERHKDRLAHYLESKTSESEKLKLCIASRTEQYEQIKLQAKTHFQVRKCARGTDLYKDINGFSHSGNLVSDKEVDLVLLKRKQALKDRNNKPDQ